MALMKTFHLKAKDINKKWYLVDGKDLVVGRAASIIAKILRGKNDPQLTPHLDHGGCIVVVNARHVRFTGNKEKVYYRHTGYPGGIKSVTAPEVLEGQFPDRVIRKAVERMLGNSGPLKRQRLKNLFVYEGPHHPHEAQKPVSIDVGSWSRKNRKSELLS